MNKPLEIVKYKGELGRLIKDAESEGGNTHFYAAGTGSYFIKNLPIVTKNDISGTTLQEKIIYLKMECSKNQNVLSEHIINGGEYIIFEVLHERIPGIPRTVIFHTYLNFLDTCKGYESLDSAIIGILECKYQGRNSQAGEMFERMLQMNTAEKIKCL